MFPTTRISTLALISSNTDSEMSEDIRIRLAEAKDAERWNSFASCLAPAWPLNRYEWRAVLAKSYNVDTRFLVAERDGNVCGVLAAYVNSGFSGKRMLYSLRHGLRAADAPTFDAFLSYLEDLQQREGLAGVQVTTGTAFFPSRHPAVVKSTVIMELGADEESTWADLSAKSRNMIRKARKKSVELVSGHNQLNPFYQIYSENMIRKGVAIHPREFFVSLLENFGDVAEIILARAEGQFIGASLLLYGKGVAHYPFQSAVYRYRTLAPIQLMNWEMIRRSIARGIRILDMGESTRDSSGHQSKINFGGVPKELYYFNLALCQKQSASHAATRKVSGKQALRAIVLAHSPMWFKRREALWRRRQGRVF